MDDESIQNLTEIRREIRISPIESPLFHEWVTANGYLWHRTVKEVMEEAIREGRVPEIIHNPARKRSRKVRVTQIEQVPPAGVDDAQTMGKTMGNAQDDAETVGKTMGNVQDDAQTVGKTVGKTVGNEQVQPAHEPLETASVAAQVVTPSESPAKPEAGNTEMQVSAASNQGAGGESEIHKSPVKSEQEMQQLKALLLKNVSIL